MAHSEYSDITPTQYDAAYAWIRDTGLLVNLNSSVPARHRVFASAIAHGEAAWLADANVLVREPDELPGDALRAAAALGMSEAEAYAQVRGVWGKVDAAERVRIGAAGEIALIELLTGSVRARIERVAEWSDGFGYDIAVRSPECRVHLEAKTTLRRSRFALYLSRHEYDTMLRDPEWQLVLVRLAPDLKPVAVATVPRGWVAAHVPSDRRECGRWESCHLVVPPRVPLPGIPALGALFTCDASPLLTGRAGWPA
ncbi:protein NO VEIN domain-containing protein [Streptomyces hoynatensis]|nr:DUF3883 domain-containing protein [Streptomyces hoynatensis]